MSGNNSHHPAAAGPEDSALPSAEYCRLYLVLMSVLCLLQIGVAWMLLDEVLGTWPDGDGVRIAPVLAALGAVGTLPLLGLLVRVLMTKPLSQRMARLRHVLMANTVEAAVFLLTAVTYFFLSV